MISSLSSMCAPSAGACPFISFRRNGSRSSRSRCSPRCAALAPAHSPPRAHRAGRRCSRSSPMNAEPLRALLLALALLRRCAAHARRLRRPRRRRRRASPTPQPGQAARLSARSWRASAISHRMVVSHRQSDGRDPARPMACNGPCSAMRARRDDGEGWDDPQAFVAHAAVTTDTLHLFAETRARGGVGQAGVEAAPFRAFIDNWSFSAKEPNLSGGAITAVAPRFRYALALIRREAARSCMAKPATVANPRADRPPITTASPSSPSKARSRIDGVERKVTGRAWMDHEWSSQSAGAADQKGWDWFSLHLDERRRADAVSPAQRRDASLSPGSFIAADGATRLARARRYFPRAARAEPRRRTPAPDALARAGEEPATST